MAADWTLEEGDMLSELWTPFAPVDALELERAWAAREPSVVLGVLFEVRSCSSMSCLNIHSL
jgi:hypothetical protein